MSELETLLAGAVARYEAMLRAAHAEIAQLRSDLAATTKPKLEEVKKP